MKNFLKYLLGLPFVLNAAFVFAQTPESTGNGGFSSTIEVGLPRALVRTARIAETPKTADTVVAVPPMTYQNLPGMAKSEFTPDNIQAANIFPKNAIPRLYHFYLRGGIGNYTMPMVELYVNDLYNKKGTWGAHAKHFSSAGGLRNVGFSGFSDDAVSLYGKRYINKLEIGGALDYRFNRMHYYGYDTSLYTFDKLAIRQQFNLIKANVYLETFSPDSNKINHREEITYYNFGDYYNARENYFRIGTTIKKRVGTEILGGNLSIQYNQFVPTYNPAGCITCLELKQQDNSQQNFIVDFNPQIYSRGKNWVANAGLKVVMDVTDSEGKFYLYPDVEFRYSLFNDIFIPYAGANGGVERNGYKTLTDENPFLMSSNFDLLNTRKLNVYAGFRGTISSEISFNTRFMFSKVKNMVLFVNDTLFSPESRFTLLYDDVDVIGLTGQLSWQVKEKIKVMGRGDYFIYDPLDQPRAWMMPNFKFTLSGLYDMYDKLILRADVFIVGTRYARSLYPIEGVNPDGETGAYEVKLKPFVDANLGAEYRYNKKMSFFVNLNNIAASDYQKWYRYPVQRFNILGGFTFSF